MVNDQLHKFFDHIRNFQDVLSGMTSENMNISSKQIENAQSKSINNPINTEEQKKFEANLQEAKNIIKNNNALLGLIDEEINYIQNTILRAVL